MVKYSGDRIDGLFSALADPTRRAIVERLTHGPLTVTDIAEPFPSSLPAISKHLTVLEHAGIIDRRLEGRTRYCTLRPTALADAADWINRYRSYWENRLDALERHLEENP